MLSSAPTPRWAVSLLGWSPHRALGAKTSGAGALRGPCPAAGPRWELQHPGVL